MMRLKKQSSLDKAVNQTASSTPNFGSARLIFILLAIGVLVLLANQLSQMSLADRTAVNQSNDPHSDRSGISVQSPVSSPEIKPQLTLDTCDKACINEAETFNEAFPNISPGIFACCEESK